MKARLPVDHSFASAAPYGLFSGEGEIFLAPGGLMLGWEVRGDDYEAASRAEIDAACERLAAAYQHLGDGDLTHMIFHRLAAPDYPRREFPARAAALIDDERRAAFEAGRYWRTLARCYLTHVPEPEIRSRFAASLFSGPAPLGRTAWRTIIEQFHERTRSFEDALAGALRVRRLNSAEMFHDLHLCLSGLDHPFALPTEPVHLNEILTDQTFYGGLEPAVGELHLRPVSIDAYPSETIPQTLGLVLSHPGRLMLSVRFICMDSYTAQRQLRLARGHWARSMLGLLDMVLEAMNVPRRRINQDAEEMHRDSSEAIAAASAGTPFGFCTVTAVVIDDEAERANLRARTLVRALRNSGLGARVEDANAVEAIKGAWPGVGWHNVRRPLLQAGNLTHLMLPTESWQGTPEIDSPYYEPHTPPPLICVGAGRAPFYFPAHVAGVSNALIVGATGSGKSVLLGTMVAAASCLPRVKIDWLDIDYSSFVLAHALGADYRELAADRAAQLAPLRHLDKPGGPEWLLAWLIRLFARWRVEPSARQVSELERALELAKTENLRTMTLFCGLVQDHEARRILHHYTAAGPWGGIFDGEPAEDDAKNFLSVYEMRGLMALGERACAPATELVLHAVESRLTGAPTFIFCDEAWRTLNDPVSGEWLYEAIRTFRKRNAGIILATQSLTEIAASSYCNLLLESCPTKVFLPNPEARGEHVRDAYLKLGLSPREIEIIAHARPRSHYYYTSPLGKRLFSCDLGPAALALCAATGHPDVKQARELLAQGGDFLNAWLRTRGLGRLATEPEATTAAVLSLNGKSLQQEESGL
jgi:type IV secretory pathway VirB4 component